MRKDNDTPDWEEAGLPPEFFAEASRRAELNLQKKKIEEAISKIDDSILVYLKVNDLKSVRIGDYGTVGVRTNTNYKLDEQLLLKAGVTVKQIEAATVKTESREYIQIYPKPKKKVVEDGE